MSYNLNPMREEFRQWMRLNDGVPVSEFIHNKGIGIDTSPTITTVYLWAKIFRSETNGKGRK